MSGKCDTNLERDVCELKAIVKTQNKRIDALIKHLQEGCKKSEEEELESTLCNMNPYIECLKPDILYHLSLDTETTDFPKVFGDVRFVCMGGTATRMEKFALFIMKEIGLKMNTSVQLKNISEPAHRYGLFKVGPVLCASHGIGGPSISILLHELIKLVYHAKCQNPIFFRLGTCGGVGVEPGTVVITSEPLDGQLRPYYEVVVLSMPEQRPAKLDAELANELKSLSDPQNDCFNTVIGKTLCTNDFYEGQGRLDGAFCNFTPERKRSFLEHISECGVINIEMESTAFAALTNQANIRAAVVCVTLLDRMDGDQIKTEPDLLKEWDARPQTLIARYIQKMLYPDDGNTSELDPKCLCAGDQANT